MGAQQNFSTHFGCQASYLRLRFDTTDYAGWSFGTNWLLGRWLSEDWKASALLNLGLSGLQGDGHGHMGLSSRLELDWETRHWLVLWAGEIDRGAQMPGIQEIQIRMGYSPFTPGMNRIQPWLMLGYFTRAGTHTNDLFALLRFLSGNWSVEFGTTAKLNHAFLGASVGI